MHFSRPNHARFDFHRSNAAFFDRLTKFFRSGRLPTTIWSRARQKNLGGELENQIEHLASADKLDKLDKTERSDYLED